MLLAARNGVYGLAMSRIIDGSLAAPARRRPADDRRVDGDGDRAGRRRAPSGRAFWITGVAVFVCWNLGTLVGALAGTAIDPQTYGLDAAFPAGFVAMVAPAPAAPPRPAGRRSSVRRSASSSSRSRRSACRSCARRRRSCSGSRHGPSRTPPSSPGPRASHDLDARAAARRRCLRLQGARAGRHRLAVVCRRSSSAAWRSSRRR